MTYYIWLTNQVDNPRWFDASKYGKLLDYLDSVPFYYILDMDKNRMMDGIDLRKKYSAYDEYRSSEFCSVLEMMIALAIRSEEYLTDDPAYGNRVSWWFLNMLRSLGLDDMTDRYFDRVLAKKAITKFLEREYDADGMGGLFYIPNYEGDLTQVEIWYQMNYWYMSLRQ